MNKGLNTFLFMLGATIFNLVLLALLILAGLFAIARLNLPPILLAVWFLVALVGSFLIYNQVVKWIARKIDMEKYFLPLFKRRPPKQGGGEGR
jgi:hypothetical protein